MLFISNGANNNIKFWTQIYLHFILQGDKKSNSKTYKSKGRVHVSTDMTGFWQPTGNSEAMYMRARQEFRKAWKGLNLKVLSSEMDQAESRLIQ